MTGRYLISGSLVSRWRRERDSNPRWDFVPYTLSRGAPSTTRPSLLKKLSPQMFCDLLNNERGGLLRAILPFALRAAVALLRRSAAVLSSAILRAGNSRVRRPWAHPPDGPTIHRIVGLTAPAPRVEPRWVSVPYALGRHPQQGCAFGQLSRLSRSETGL